MHFMLMYSVDSPSPPFLPFSLSFSNKIFEFVVSAKSCGKGILLMWLLILTKNCKLDIDFLTSSCPLLCFKYRGV